MQQMHSGNTFDNEQCMACQCKRTPSIQLDFSAIGRAKNWISRQLSRLSSSEGKEKEKPKARVGEASPVDVELDWWTCPTCGNKTRGTACVHCYDESHWKMAAATAEKQSATSGWTCQFCTFRNESDWTDVCVMCQKGKESDVGAWRLSVQSLGEAGDSWECQTCKRKNSRFLTVCETCGHCGGDSLKKSHPWSCNACTLINREEADHCQVCNEPKAQPVKTQRPFLGRQQSTCVDAKRKEDETKAISQWNYIVKVCQRRGDSYVDPSFPPLPKSLYLKPRHSDNPRVACWLRPDNFRQNGTNRMPWTLFRTPRPSDIRQGVVGNCWFLSALAVLAEEPKLVEKIIISDKICNEGVYQVRLCQNGIWQVLLIDDTFPCDKHGMLVYSQADRRQLWVPIIEKALAKLLGCYEAMKGGACIEGLSILTGAPCEKISLQVSLYRRDRELDADLIWGRIISMKEAGFVCLEIFNLRLFCEISFLMGASCGSLDNSVSEEEFKSVGLVPQYAYSVLDIKQVLQERLIRLRNPWGSHSWRGDWSDKSPLWTKSLRSELQVYGAGEGVFWIALRDLMRYFNRIDVCKVRPDWSEVRLKLCLESGGKGPSHVIQMEVLADTQIDICLYQPNSRHNVVDSMVDLCLVVLAILSFGEAATSAVNVPSRHA
eukprot:m.249668 g.249668  ORF g.249668 m.249668 type:complete len:660 (+) comp40307_c0_seq10:668-2647(+)